MFERRDAECAERGRDPGVEMRRQISFEATNLIGSSQDDGAIKTRIKAPDATLKSGSTRAKPR
jgi:hypothetical protein